MTSYTIDPPEAGMAYGYQWYRPDSKQPTGVYLTQTSLRLLPRGDWDAARRRNPTLKRTVEGEPYRPADHRHFDLDAVPTLTPPTFTEEYKREFLRREEWRELPDGKWLKIEATTRGVPGTKVQAARPLELDQAFELVFWRRGGVETFASD